MYRIIINPELGGNQTGKSYNNKYEKDFNLKISKALNSKLNSLGINSTLVRNNDKLRKSMFRFKHYIYIVRIAK